MRLQNTPLSLLPGLRWAGDCKSMQGVVNLLTLHYNCIRTAIRFSTGFCEIVACLPWARSRAGSKNLQYNNYFPRKYYLAMRLQKNTSLSLH